MNALYDVILSAVEPKTKVLDLGCGDGTLLSYLKQHKQIQDFGVEIEFENIASCVQKGIPVYQGNIEEALFEFSDKAYDYVILSQTLQEIHNPLVVINEMLRVGKKAIVTFPNFGYWKIRAQLFFTGHSPRTKELPFEWYNTPNIRVITISDFKRLCTAQGYKILQGPNFLGNAFSQKGFFVLTV